MATVQFDSKLRKPWGALVKVECQITVNEFKLLMNETLHLKQSLFLKNRCKTSSNGRFRQMGFGDKGIKLLYLTCQTFRVPGLLFHQY